MPSYGSLRMYDDYNQDYQTIYKTQPNVSTAVDFLARNVAQLGLHTYRRVSDTDRQRLTDHPFAQTIKRPNPFTTTYRLIASMMSDLGIFDNAYWYKFRRPAFALLRIPPQMVTVYGGLMPTAYEIGFATKALRVPPSEIVHFRGYNPDSATTGLSNIEKLRRILAEEYSMSDYREYFWRNSARMGGIIKRPLEAPEWSADARARFTAEFEALYSGGTNSGKTAVLEDGMEWQQGTFSAQESEYLLGRKLTREEVARAYHIPLPMVGILDNATFSNIREQHKNLYQDCLGPWLRMIEEEIELQLLPDFADTEDVYVEFNIQEKLAGSFEEQANALSTLVGRPIMMANEARARLNLPRATQPDADRLVTPLNVLTGGQASPRDSAPPKALGMKAAGDVDPTQPELRARLLAAWQSKVVEFFTRQEKAIVSRTPAKANVNDIWNDEDRWNDELADEFFVLNLATALAFANYVAGRLDSSVDEERMYGYLRENARIASEEVNALTRAHVADALLLAKPKDEVREVFRIAREVRAPEIAEWKTNTAANFGSSEGAKAGGLRRKTWVVNSVNPRDEHAAMNGQTVDIEKRFSNGMLWPGDPAGGAANNAHCQCSVRFSRGADDV